MFAVVFCVFLLLIFIVVRWYPSFKELKTYYRIVKKPEDLLLPGIGVVLKEYPNIGKKSAVVEDETFSHSWVIAKLLRDIEYLKKNGHDTEIEYFFDKTHPLSKEVFDVLLSEYHTKLSEWRYKKTIFTSRKTKPLAPYDFSKLRVIPAVHRRERRDMRA